MKIVPATFLKRLADFDPQLVLRWAAPRRQWAVERLTVTTDAEIDPASARDWFDWNRGRFRACCLREVNGQLVGSREWRDVPRHLFWWPGPLGGQLLETLRWLRLETHGSAAAAWDATMGRRLEEQHQAEAGAYRELAEVRRDLKQQVRRATGQETFIAT